MTDIEKLREHFDLLREGSTMLTDALIQGDANTALAIAEGLKALGDELTAVWGPPNEPADGEEVSDE